MLEKYEIVTSMFHGFNYNKFFTAEPKERLAFIPSSMEHILKQKEGKERYLKHVSELSKAFALSVPNEKALKIKDEVGFFQAVRSAIVKNTILDIDRIIEKEELDSSIKQIVSKAVISDRVIDIFAAAGLKKPDISILSEGFLKEVKELPQKNLAFEMLKKLLNDEIKIRMRKNLIQGRSFREMLEKTIRKYTNRNIEAAKVIEELIDLAKKMRESDKEGKKLNLTEEERAFYDALWTNDSAVKVLGDETLKAIARELVDIIRKNVTIDWTLRESAQAKLRVMVKRVLKKHNYPPDKQKRATETVLEQAALTCRDWAEA
jgi:type I restriction enzyme R subunit